MGFHKPWIRSYFWAGYITSHKMMTWKPWLWQKPSSEANAAQFRPRLPQSVGMPGTFFGVFLLVQSVLLTSKKSSKFWKKRFRTPPKHTMTFLHIRSQLLGNKIWFTYFFPWHSGGKGPCGVTQCLPGFLSLWAVKKNKKLGWWYVSDETLPLWSIVALESGNPE